MAGTVEEINISPRPEELPTPRNSVEVVAGQGVRGDRYYRETGGGTFSEAEKTGQDLTLIEAEALEGLLADTGIELSAAESRRNVLTRGIGLNDLVGKRFRVGEVECVGNRLCDPCSHLQSVTKPGVLRGLVNRGGLRADVVRGGRIAVGDQVAEL